MKNLQEYISQLTKRDRLLLFIVAGLFAFLIIKLLIVDGLAAQNKLLNKRANLVQKQTIALETLRRASGGSSIANIDSSQVITNFLRGKGISENLKQIRTTSKGEQRIEIEDIQFSLLVEMLSALDKNGSMYNSLQVKNRKTPGLVSTIITIPN